MKITILGSGLLGVTLAYELGKRGHTVSVIDRCEESARETSYANGGQLSYSHAEPWASPSVLPKLPKWLFRSDAPLVFRPRADWPMIKWGLRFLRNCTEERAAVNCVNILRLGLYSKQKMDLIRQDTNIAFDYANRGVLHIYGTEKDFEAAKRHNDFQAKFGCEQRVLTREETLTMEPALSNTQRAIVGGIHAFMDESGDPYLFTNALAKICEERHKTVFRYNMNITSVNSRDGRISSISTDNGEMEADAYVMALGSYSPLYLKPLGINIPVYPMKGYSITLPANEFCPNVSLTDGTFKIVYSRLGDRLRIAGTAEFAGHNKDINEKRIEPIVRSARALFPKADWEQPYTKWACLRPSTPDGPPIMGPTPYPNLFLNTGHGTLGWTQAAGSASFVADAIEGKPPEILLHGLTLPR